ncbi:MAG: PP2C family protein-serine/threonine phosphatase [Saccharofermentans sp.]|nr:PP2C family protein-serine/threonine phosphatase [Saccharofermentans sp.]
MNKDKKNTKSLSAKTLRSTIVSCIIFGLVAQIVALSFYAYSLTKKFIDIGYSVATQAKVSAQHGADGNGFSYQIMDIYNSLTPEQKAKMGTEEYRSYYAGVDMEKGSTYDLLYNILLNNRRTDEIQYIYLATFDKENNAIIYITDCDENPDTAFLPGDWEYIDPKEIDIFTNDFDPEAKKFFLDMDENVGPLCTVAMPLITPEGDIPAFLFVDVSVKEVIQGLLNLAIQLFIMFVVLTVLLAVVQTRSIKKKLVTPINKIADASKAYVNDRMNGIDNKEHFQGLGIDTNDELENLADTMNDMEKNIAEYEANLTQIISEKQRINTELSLATTIQEAMLPHVFPPFPNRKEFDIYAKMKPAREVGGDFYDYFLIDDDHLGLVIADVSGKGIPAALFMMISMTILKNAAKLGNSPAEILRHANESLCANNPTDMFVTTWVGILEISTGKLEASNGGHEYPIIKRAGGDYQVYTDPHGFVVGGLRESLYHNYRLDLKPGDKLFLYTDGVPEATNSENKLYKMTKLVEVLNSKKDATVQEQVENIEQSISTFVKDAEQFDDLTMLAIEYKGK